ncbi:MAG: hypothetical protein E5V62_03000 [Mesorhizobium sp.]|uniref:hypothetical protein n=1 Tax=Mesorhizobium sp. TaxID=1871066 RepID=UPI000FD2A7FA|nr:hypothetical protein [Mesorhizobium sp.]RVD68839.1 hypothetical protein EN751_29265 [Mesorhizobium sp. M4A.F.Ca.ET.029.04.2.1]TIW37133.1 MAG: hypothetical protein E5V62_03000 [Mesorhizobium sp.]
MIDFEGQDDSASGFALFPARATLLAEQAPSLNALFRCADRWSPASHQAIPKTTARMVAMLKAVRMAEAIISRTLVGCVTAGCEL